ncbi:hypothetical protein QBC37DRAFT_393642, partial [Rhypophila decipiens]
MGWEMTPIFCTAEVPVETLSEILQDSYYKGYKSIGLEPSDGDLLLVHDKNTLPSAKKGKTTKDTIPPISAPPTSDFHSATYAQLITHVLENADKDHDCSKEGYISGDMFLIADNQTVKDKTLRLVCKRYLDSDDEDELYEITHDFASARIASDQPSITAVNLGVGNTDIGELKSCADEDGVLRMSKDERVHPSEPEGGYLPPIKLEPKVNVENAGNPSGSELSKESPIPLVKRRKFLGEDGVEVLWLSRDTTDTLVGKTISGAKGDCWLQFNVKTSEVVKSRTQITLHEAYC